jgi:hypothetical protein
VAVAADRATESVDGCHTFHYGVTMEAMKTVQAPSARDSADAIVDAIGATLISARQADTSPAYTLGDLLRVVQDRVPGVNLIYVRDMIALLVAQGHLVKHGDPAIYDLPF